MLNLILNISGSIAFIGNIFLLMAIFVFGKDKMQNKSTRFGFLVMRILILLNILTIGGNVLC